MAVQMGEDISLGEDISSNNIIQIAGNHIHYYVTISRYDYVH